MGACTRPFQAYYLQNEILKSSCILAGAVGDSIGFVLFGERI